MTDTQQPEFLTARDRKNLPQTSISLKVMNAARTISEAVQCPDQNITAIRREAALRLFNKKIKSLKSKNEPGIPPVNDEQWLHILALQAIAWGNLLYPRDAGLDRALLVSLAQSNGEIDTNVSKLLNQRLYGLQIIEAKRLIENLAIQVRDFDAQKSRIIKLPEMLLIEVWTGTETVPPLALMTNEAAAKVHSELYLKLHKMNLTVREASDFIRLKRKLGLKSYSSPKKNPS